MPVLTDVVRKHYIDGHYTHGDGCFTYQGATPATQCLTEGNARVLNGPANQNGVILARSIEGHEINFQVKYKF